MIFSDGTCHSGKAAIETAYRRNFATIENEDFRIADVQWVSVTDAAAAYQFEFHWSGRIQGQPASGAGRGTAVLARHDGAWQLMAEHLGPKR